MQEGEGAQQGWVCGRHSEEWITGICCGQKAAVTSWKPLLWLRGGGGCMRPAFWEPSAYWVMKIQKHEFPELLRVESGHLTPSTWMNGLSFSPRKVWICISPWETSRPEVEFAVSFRAAPSFCLPPHPPWAHAHARNNLNLNPQPSRAPAAWSLTRPFKLYLKLATVRQKRERTCFSSLFSCVIYFINVGFVVFCRQIFRTAPVFWQVISCAITLSGVSVGLWIKQLTEVIKTSGYSEANIASAWN